MKVLIDMTFVSQKTLHNSIPIVVFRLLGGIPPSERSKFKLLFDRGCVEMLHNMFPDYEYTTVNVYNNRRHYYDPRLLLCPFNLKRAINNSGCDIVFFPCDGNRYAIFKFNIPIIVMIHDLKWLKSDTKNDHSKFIVRLFSSIRGHRAYREKIESASKIVTISQYTKSDLLSFFPNTDPSKIHVIYNSIPLIEGSRKPSSLSDDEKYVLNINSILSLKNPLTLLKAFSLIADNYKGKLVLVGRKTVYWDEELEPFIEKNKLEDKVIRLQNIDDEEIRYLYEHADLFVTPSLHEGFGLTPVEAAIYCCPVISSRCESLPEATMGLVNYYEPATDENALAKEMRTILSNPPSRSQLKEISKTLTERYTPSNQAKELLSLLDI